MTEVRQIVWREANQYKPEPGVRVLCLTKTKKGVFNYVLGYYDPDVGIGWVCGMNSNVVAWSYLPEAPDWTL